MNLEETPPKQAPVEIRFNVLNGATGERLNSEPLTEEAARLLASKLHESDAGAPLVIRSERATLME
jgi:hypothetical protein